MHNSLILVYPLSFLIPLRNIHYQNYLFLKISKFISKIMINLIYLYRKQVIFGGNFE